MIRKTCDNPLNVRKKKTSLKKLFGEMPKRGKGLSWNAKTFSAEYWVRTHVALVMALPVIDRYPSHG